jgi:6-phosphogluconolactonase
MGDFELIKFHNSDELARAAAREWLIDLQANRKPDQRYCVALAGGRIAGRFFSEVATLATKDPVPLFSIDYFWGDERCVPPADPESNFRLAQEQMLVPLNIPAQRIHRIHGEKSPETAAAEAETELCGLASSSVDGQPVIDLIFLGIGEEGHTASLFPGEPPDVVGSKRVYRAVTATKPPPQRITLGYRAIAAANKVWVLASGPGKEGAFRQSLSSEGQTPFARILKSRSHTRVFTDLVP